MKLNILSARVGLTWIKLGVAAFFKQPALSALFFLSLAVLYLIFAALSLISTVLWIGNVLALALVPAITLGMMVATLESTQGKIPTPLVLAIAFRAGRQRGRAMLILGAMYAAAFLFILGLSALFDGGQFAKLYLLGDALNQEVLKNPPSQIAALVAMLLYLPLSLLFWHAPALVHWYDMPPSKAIFFSFLACSKNFWAYLAYGAGWFAMFFLGALTIIKTALFFSSPVIVPLLIFPMSLTIAAMAFSSLYFTFRDSFIHDNTATPTPTPPTLL